MTAIIFIAVLLITVLVHEWGHYFAARRSGMKVDEFGFGIPPKVASWKGKETTFSLNALPIGGFVKIAGENTIEPRTDVAPERLFLNRPRYQQALVLVAGVVCNFLLGWILLSAAFMIGVPQVVPEGTPEVISVLPKSPAEDAGIRLHDRIIEIRSAGTVIENPHTEDIRSLLQNSETQSKIQLTVEREGKLELIPIIPAIDSENGTRSIGIAAEPIAVITLSPFKAMWVGLKESVLITKSVVVAFGNLIATLVQGKGGLEAFIGPVGLAGAVSEAASVGISYFLSFVALISLNLAVLNLIPFPALDGGRLLILGLEAVTRRKFSQEVVGIIHIIGFMLLIALMIALTIQDIKRIG